MPALLRALRHLGRPGLRPRLGGLVVAGLGLDVRAIALLAAWLLSRLYRRPVALGLGIGRHVLLAPGLAGVRGHVGLGASLLGRHLVAELVLAGPRRVVRRHRASLHQAWLYDLLGTRPAALTNPRGTPHAVAQVVELRAPHISARRHLDPLDLRRVDRERPLHAHAEGLLADGERLARP